MNILSLFDGISCGKVALERAGIKVSKYYASEIDKYAIYISKKNHPNIIQLGDINNWKDWSINFSKIDLLLAGFPCQSWSLAGKQEGDKDPRGKLMWVMLDILNHVQKFNPEVKFLFENVVMKKELLGYVNKAIGVESIEINSALVSAQNRKRLYWTNIQGIEHPSNKNIYLKDILENGVVDRDKRYCIDDNYWKGGNLKSYFTKSKRQLVFQIGYIKQNHRGSRIYSKNGKSVTLCSSGGGWGMKTGLYKDGLNFRKLTPIECERLQTLPDNYTEGISNSQRYKCLGNGWTVDVIAHILKHIMGN